MKATEFKNEIDRRYAERMDAKTTSVRDEIAAISSHPYDDFDVEDYIDPRFYIGLVAGKSGKALNFHRKGQKGE